MRKKINAILTVVLIATVLLVLFASCGSSKVDYFDYSIKDLGPIGRLIYIMHTKWIHNYGWTVVVFTVFLKIIMLPLDFWQRYASRKSSLKMQRIQPLLDGIDKRYGANTQRANEEKQKLYKKQGYSMLSTCLPMILSMAIFFVMFGGLRNYSTYCTITTFQDLSTKYYQTLDDEFRSDAYSEAVREAYKNAYDENYATKKGELAKDTTDEDELAKYDEIAKLFARINASKAVTTLDAEAASAANEKAKVEVQKMYQEEKESWLWIKNVWQPDTWATVMPAFDSGANSFTGGINMESYPDVDHGATTYKVIRNAILEVDGYGKDGTWNGLMILPVLSIALSFLSMFISQRLEKKNRKGEPQPEPTTQNQQQQATNKMMMIMMPAMMAVFGFMYTGAFAIYMVVNYTLSIITTIAMRWPVEKIVEKSLAKNDQKDKTGKASYMR